MNPEDFKAIIDQLLIKGYELSGDTNHHREDLDESFQNGSFVQLKFNSSKHRFNIAHLSNNAYAALCITKPASQITNEYDVDFKVSNADQVHTIVECFEQVM